MVTPDAVHAVPAAPSKPVVRTASSAPAFKASGCERETFTNMSEWYKHIPRKANKTDCASLCFNDRKQWCTGYEFSTALNGTCKMFDECSFQPKATGRHLGLADLNRMYRNGGPSNDVAKAGLFVHQHESAEEWDKPLFDVSSQAPLPHWAGSLISRATSGLYSTGCGIILAPQVRARVRVRVRIRVRVRVRIR